MLSRSTFEGDPDFQPGEWFVLLEVWVGETLTLVGACRFRCVLHHVSCVCGCLIAIHMVSIPPVWPDQFEAIQHQAARPKVMKMTGLDLDLMNRLDLTSSARLSSDILGWNCMEG